MYPSDLSDNWKLDLDWSHAAFLREIAPALKEKWGGEFYPVQAEKDPQKRMLDQSAGIDFFHHAPGGVVRSIASRVQVADHNGRSYETFTIRLARDSGAETEYAKLKRAIREASVYPGLTCQGYVTDRGPNGKLISFAIAKTNELWPRLERGARKRTSNASFVVVEWGDWCDFIYHAPTPPPAAQTRELLAPCPDCGGKLTRYGDTRVMRRLIPAPNRAGWLMTECGHSYVKADDPAVNLPQSAERT